MKTRIKVIFITLFSLLLIPSPLTAQTSGSNPRCKPDALVEAVNSIGQSPITDALNLYTSTTASVGNLAETYNDLMNYRVTLEDEWSNIRECDPASIEIYNAMLRITTAMQDITFLSILFKSDIATEVETAQQSLFQRIGDDIDLIETVQATQE